jgi:hypothetical protein
LIMELSVPMFGCSYPLDEFQSLRIALPTAAGRSYCGRQTELPTPPTSCITPSH